MDRSDARDGVLALVICAVLGFTVYANSLQVPFYLDDLRNIIDNRLIWLRNLSPGSLWHAAFDSPIWTRPVANLSFALNYYLHGESVAGYHLVNIVIHVLTGFVLFLLARSLLSAPALAGFGKNRFVLPLLATLLWLVHPLHTQTVTYIVQRMTSLATLFYLVSLWLYARGRLQGRLKESWPWYAGSCAAAVLAIGSKEIALTLPFFVLLFEIYFFRDLDRRWLAVFISCAVFLALFSILALLLIPLDSFPLFAGYENRPFTPWQRQLTEFRIVLWYLGLFVFPHPGRLNLDHDFALSLSLVQPPATLLSLAVILSLLVLAALLARKERLLSFAILWYFGNLALESSVVNLELVFEHRTYLPSVFVTLALVDLWLRWVRVRWLAMVGLLLIVVTFSGWTVMRNRVWRDPVEFWADSAAKSSGKARPFINLSAAYRERGDYAKAIDAAQTAIRLDSRFVNGFFALGNAYYQQGDMDRAMAAYREVLRRMPEYAEVHNALAGVYLRKGMMAEAAASLRETLRLEPLNFNALVNLASIKAYQGRYAEAIADLERALEIGGEKPDILFNLALAHARSGNRAQAIAAYRRVLELNPADMQARQSLEALTRQEAHPR